MTFLYLQTLFSTYLRMFFLFTPFFILSTYLSLIQGIEGIPQARLVRRITGGIIGVTMIIFFCGQFVMRLFGITLAAFQTGSGILLILTAITLVLGHESKVHADSAENLLNMAVVPLAVPVTAGPASLGFILVLGTTTEYFVLKLVTAFAIILASLSIGVLLYFATWIERKLGKANLSICSKVTGLILAAIAVQMIMEGAKALWLAQ